MDLTMSATGAAELVRRQEISARELTEAVLARIDAVNPALHAVVEQRRDAALAEAAAADQASDRSGALHGVPITIKESFHVAGLHSTWGNPELRDFVATRDATIVGRLRRAGAIVVGTTNVALMLGDVGQSTNPVYGTTSNPWDLARTPGGSSGGAAAAVAAGASMMDYGSDLAGSVRVPAAFCGVYGLRPTAGSVPLRGLSPGDAPTLPDEQAYLGAIGPLARSAEDLRTALLVTAGPEDPADRAYAWSLAAPRHTRLADFRVGVVLDDPRCPLASDIGAVLSNTVDGLARAGARVVEGWPDGYDVDTALATFRFHLDLFFSFQQPGPDAPGLAAIMEQQYARLAARAAWARHFSEVDVVLAPTNFTAPYPHDTRPFAERTVATPEGERSYADQGFWIAPVSLTGLPAVAAPVGLTAGGLPVGIQIIGAHHEDDTAITFAELLADLRGGYRPPPLSTVD